jgi:hypothetical protein
MPIGHKQRGEGQQGADPMPVEKLEQEQAKIKEVQQEVTEKLRRGESLLEVERWLFGVMVLLGQLIFQAALQALLDERGFCRNILKRAKQSLGAMRSKGRVGVTLRTLFGQIKIRTTHWVQQLKDRRGRKRGRRHRGGTGIYPLLWMLGIADRCTPAAQAEISRAMVLCSSAQEASQLLACRGIDLAPKLVCHIAYQVGQRAINGRDAMLAQPQNLAKERRILAGKRVAIAADGGRYRARINRRGRRSKHGRHRFDTPWKEPKGFVIYVLNEQGKRDPNFRPISDFTIGDADAVTELMIATLRAYGITEAEELAVVGDGAHWIWNRVPQLRQALELEQHGVRVTEILDFYHAMEHLNELSRLRVKWTEEQRQSWVKDQRRALKAGQHQEVVTAIEQLGQHLGKSQLKRFNTEREYFCVTHASRMRYADYKAAHLPCGSGAIESAVRRVVNQRVKSNATFWLPQHAEFILHMRAQLKFQRFDDMILLATSPVPASAFSSSL